MPRVDRRRRVERLLERPVLDYLGALAVTGTLLGLSKLWSDFDVLGGLTAGQRADLYSKAIGPLSILASVATAGLAVYASGHGPRMALLRTVHGERLLRQFRGAAIAAGTVVVLLLVAYVGDVGHHAPWARWLALGSLAFALIRAVRVLYFYNGLLRTAGEDTDAPVERRPSLDDQPVPR